MPSRSPHSLPIRSLVAFTSLLAACVGEATATTSDAILNGTAVSAATAEQMGVGHIGDCTGVMIRNEWMITAARCFDAAQRVNPVALTITMGTQTTHARTIIASPSRNPDTDSPLLLIRLATPFTVAGLASGFIRQVATQSIRGARVTCYGYGDNDMAGNGAGVLRRGAARLNDGWPYFINLADNPQSPYLGDLGGPCFTKDGLLGGVVSYVDSTFPNALLSVPGFGGNWIAESMGEAAPSNDNRANAIQFIDAQANVTLGAENVLGGNTLSATHDGPTVPCACTGGGDVWFRFHVDSPTAVYLDTSGSDFDTSLLVTDANGAPVPGQPGINPNLGLCNDDAVCPTNGGFSTPFESRTMAVVQPGWYYVAVGGCGAGRFALHYQHVALGSSTQLLSTPMSGTGTLAGQVPAGTSQAQLSCGGSPNAPEQSRWFVSCGEQFQTLSLCPSDGGSFQRASGGVMHDPAMSIRSAATNSAVDCNDDGLSRGGTDCTGTGGDFFNYGSRLPDVLAPRGLNVVDIEDRTGASGMNFTLRYILQ